MSGMSNFTDGVDGSKLILISDLGKSILGSVLGNSSIFKGTSSGLDKLFNSFSNLSMSLNVMVSFSFFLSFINNSIPGKEELGLTSSKLITSIIYYLRTINFKYSAIINIPNSL